MTPQQQALHNLRIEVILREHTDPLKGLRRFWASVHESLDDLEAGRDSPEDIMAFTIHQCCDGFWYQQEFLDAYATEISSAAVLIQAICSNLLDSLDEHYGK